MWQVKNNLLFQILQVRGLLLNTENFIRIQFEYNLKHIYLYNYITFDYLARKPNIFFI